MISKKEMIKVVTLAFLTNGLLPIAMFVVAGIVIDAPETIGSLFYASVLIAFLVVLGIYLLAVYKINKNFN